MYKMWNIIRLFDFKEGLITCVIVHKLLNAHKYNNIF